MDTDEAAAQLYALPPSAFTARRTELAAQAKRAGEPASAKEIGALRRPTVSAWCINVLAAEEDGALAELLEVAHELRRAQSDLDAPRMSELSARRRALVQGVQARSKEVAAGQGQSLSAGALREVEETMAAAVASEEAADAVSSGRLTRALSYAGFGEVDLSDATATPLASTRRSAAQEATPTPASRPRLRLVESAPPRAEPRPRRDTAEEARVSAAQHVQEAREAVERTTDQVAAAQAASDEAAEAVRRLHEELSQARSAATAATRAVTTAERRHDSAKVTLTNAERRLRTAEKGRGSS